MCLLSSTTTKALQNLTKVGGLVTKKSLDLTNKVSDQFKKSSNIFDSFEKDVLMEDWYQDLKIERDAILKQSQELRVTQVKMPQDLKKDHAIKKLKEKVFLDKKDIKWVEAQEA